MEARRWEKTVIYRSEESISKEAGPDQLTGRSEVYESSTLMLNRMQKLYLLKNNLLELLELGIVLEQHLRIALLQGGYHTHKQFLLFVKHLEKKNHHLRGNLFSFVEL